jgi:folate-binding protein YgfZ
LINSEFIKYGAVDLEDITAIHLNGDFDSVLSLLQGQVTSDCALVSEQMGQISSLCNEKGFILCNFEIIVDKNKWLIIIEKDAKDIFLDEIAKFLPFYKISAELLSCRVIGFSREKNQSMLQHEHSILTSEKVSLSLLIDQDNEFQGDLGSISKESWAINRKIMNDHQIKPEEIGKYRPHEIGQHINRVSFAKGCFKGQEIIARMEYLGKLKKETNLIIHSNIEEVSKFKIIGKSYHDNEKIFSSCLGKIGSFS